MLNALKKGESLQNPELWKKVQMVIAVAAGFLPLVIVFFPSLQWLLDKDVAGKLIAGIGGLMSYLTVATSEKIGF